MKDSSNSKLEAWLITIRPKTLLVSLAPVILGASFLKAPKVYLSFTFWTVLLAATCIQIIANLVNDLFDDERGADGEDRAGPKRGLQMGTLKRLDLVKAVWGLVLTALCLGGYLVFLGGWPIFCIGVFSIASAFAYTAGKYSLAYTGLADFFVLIFFGPVAVCGTEYLLGGNPSDSSYILGLALGSLATAILVVNNLRDVETDSAVSKNTLSVRFGKDFSKLQYTVLFFTPAVCCLYLILRNELSIDALLALIYLVPGVSVVKKVLSETELNKCLENTAKCLLGFSLLLSIAIII